MDTTKNRPTPAARPIDERFFCASCHETSMERRNFRPTMATAVGVAVGVPEAQTAAAGRADKAASLLRPSDESCSWLAAALKAHFELERRMLSEAERRSPSCLVT